MIRFIIIRLSSVSDRRRIRQGLMICRRSHHHHHHLFLCVYYLRAQSFAKRPIETNAVFLFLFSFCALEIQNKLFLMIKTLLFLREETREKKREEEREREETESVCV